MTVSRRTLLGATTAVLAFPGAPGVAGRGQPAPHPDAALIELCRQHPLNMDAYNTSPAEIEDADDNPFWIAYSETRDGIGDAQPATMAGILAKCRAAKAEAGPDGDEDPDGTPAADWAWDIVNDLLRLYGGGGAVMSAPETPALPVAIEFVERMATHLDESLCTLRIVVESACAILDVDHCVEGGALRSVERDLAAQVADMYDDIREFKAQPELYFAVAARSATKPCAS